MENPSPAEPTGSTSPVVQNVPTVPNWSYDDYDLCCQLQIGTVFFEVPRCRLYANEAPQSQIIALLRRMKRGKNTSWLTLDDGDVGLISCQVQQNMLAINFEGLNDYRHGCDLLVSSDAAQRLLDDLIRGIGDIYA